MVLQPQAQPTVAVAPPARRGRRRRGDPQPGPSAARRTRSNRTDDGESTRQSRPTRSSARHAFYGNGDSEDDFILP